LQVTAKTYASRHGITPGYVRRLARNGRFKTATRPGNEWLLDAEEPLPTAPRLKSGKYIGARSRKGRAAAQQPIPYRR